MLSECYNGSYAKMWEEFAARIINLGYFASSFCSSTQRMYHMHYIDMALGCTGLLYHTLLVVYEVTLPMILIREPYIALWLKNSTLAKSNRTCMVAPFDLPWILILAIIVS